MSNVTYFCLYHLGIWCTICVSCWIIEAIDDRTNYSISRFLEKIIK